MHAQRGRAAFASVAFSRKYAASGRVRRSRRPAKKNRHAVTASPTNRVARNVKRSPYSWRKAPHPHANSTSVAVTSSAANPTIAADGQAVRRGAAYVSDPDGRPARPRIAGAEPDGREDAAERPQVVEHPAVAGRGEPLAPVPLHLLVQGQRVSRFANEIVALAVPHPPRTRAALSASRGGTRRRRPGSGIPSCRGRHPRGRQRTAAPPVADGRRPNPAYGRKIEDRTAS